MVLRRDPVLKLHGQPPEYALFPEANAGETRQPHGDPQAGSHPLQGLTPILERIAATLERIALGLEPLTRIAAALDPSPPDIVGTHYVAERLGQTTVWISEMARQGVIPANCIVPGTGNGKVWKFYRDTIDKWLANR